MKFYKKDSVVYSFEADGSQDHLIEPDMVLMTEEEIEAHLMPNLVAWVSHYRASKESHIINYAGISSYCDKESETGLSECINNIMDNGGEKTISWEGPSGYVAATLEALSGLRKEVVDFRQKTRDAERMTILQHTATPFLTKGSIESAFDGFMGV